MRTPVMRTPISFILHTKGTDVVTISPEATVYDAISRMVDYNVGSIVVVDDANTICGIFTERDYLRRIVLQGRTSKTTRVADVMTPEVICVPPSTAVDECMALMTQKKCRHLPVLDGEGRLAGIVSIGDCVRETSTTAQRQVETLTSYIVGAYPA